MPASREGRSRVPSRDVAASAAGAVVYSLALAVASVALPLLALRAGWSAFGVGALTAVSAVSQMATRMVLGAVMRRYADWTLVAASGVLLAASCGLAALSAAAVPFVLAQLVQGVSRACFWTGTQTHVVRGEGTSASALATVNLMASVGLLAGPALAGLLSERTPVLALAVGAVIALAAVVPTLLLDRLPPFVQPDDRPPGRLWRRPGVDIGCWGGVTAGAWRGLLGSYVPVALDAARQSPSTIGVLVSVANGAALVGSAAAGRVPVRWTRSTVLSSMVVTGAATAATAALAGHVALSAVSARRQRAGCGDPAGAGPRHGRGRRPPAGARGRDRGQRHLPRGGAVRRAAGGRRPGARAAAGPRRGRRRARHDGAGARPGATLARARGRPLTCDPSLRSTPTRTFVALPAVVLAEQALAHRRLHLRWVPVLAWGWLQYRLAGRYRLARAGGPPGLSQGRPDALVTSGPYALTRNPMYLGHLVFVAGLALLTRSPVALAATAALVPWFDGRARTDHARLLELFGEPYAQYAARVPRWLPGLPTDR